MKWFRELQPSTKLTLSFGFFLLLLGMVILISLNTIHRLNKTNENLYQNQFLILEKATYWDDINNGIQVQLYHLLFIKDKTELDQTLSKLAHLDSEDEKNEQYFLENVPENAILKSSLIELQKIRAEVKNIRQNDFMFAIKSDNLEQAKKILFENLKPKYEAMSDIFDKMVQESKRLASLGVDAAQKEAQSAFHYFLAAIIIAVCLSLIFMFGLSRMIRSLKELTKEISDVILFLNTSSSEIATATAQLSSTASETATSISETSSTIEEVKQTSHVASNKAKEVSDAAKKTSKISEKGKKAADEVNEAIGNIQSQMNTVAETMMRLSEQSQMIGDIIASVEDLAQQTNLLAVNASIEASKAGEQGKGFSVVAQEVKSLATQSKQATTQVRSILNDIQKATSAAVMATELGNKAVEAGAIKTEDAGATIISLVDTVTGSSQAASQIAAVSHQQLVGMEQAAVAMENIKQASSQNVESAKLLNISIEKIKELAVRLKDLIGQYKMG